ncbi:MAG: RNA 2',3'-cyclic phosphodiesterase [Burkholderiales bacterium]
MTGDTARVFFGVWPAPEVQRALEEIARRALSECGGRAVALRNIHLTLVFLGDLPRDRLATLETLASTVQGRRFNLTVDRLEYWRHNRILWAGASACPEALHALVARLQDAVAGADFRFDRRPYVPHVTLLRNARRAPEFDRCPAVEWPVDGFALVESAPRERGRAYQILRSWPFDG